MAHLINSKAMRVGQGHDWCDLWFSKKYHYAEHLYTCFRIRYALIHLYFSKSQYKLAIYSHFFFIILNKTVHIHLFLYDNNFELKYDAIKFKFDKDIIDYLKLKFTLNESSKRWFLHNMQKPVKHVYLTRLRKLMFKRWRVFRKIKSLIKASKKKLFYFNENKNKIFFSRCHKKIFAYKKRILRFNKKILLGKKVLNKIRKNFLNIKKFQTLYKKFQMLSKELERNKYEEREYKFKGFEWKLFKTHTLGQVNDRWAKTNLEKLFTEYHAYYSQFKLMGYLDWPFKIKTSYKVSLVVAHKTLLKFAYPPRIFPLQYTIGFINLEKISSIEFKANTVMSLHELLNQWKDILTKNIKLAHKDEKIKLKKLNVWNKKMPNGLKKIYKDLAKKRFIIRKKMDEVSVKMHKFEHFNEFFCKKKKVSEVIDQLFWLKSKRLKFGYEIDRQTFKKDNIYYDRDVIGKWGVQKPTYLVLYWIYLAKWYKLYCEGVEKRLLFEKRNLLDKEVSVLRSDINFKELKIKFNFKLKKKTKFFKKKIKFFKKKIKFFKKKIKLFKKKIVNKRKVLYNIIKVNSRHFSKIKYIRHFFNRKVFEKGKIFKNMKRQVNSKKKLCEKKLKLRFKPKDITIVFRAWRKFCQVSSFSYCIESEEEYDFYHIFILINMFSFKIRHICFQIYDIILKLLHYVICIRLKILYRILNFLVK